MKIGDIVNYIPSEYDTVNFGIDGETDYVGIVLAIDTADDGSESYALRVMLPNGRDITANVSSDAEADSPGSIAGAGKTTAKSATTPKAS
jgi:hypothetical protein